MSFKCEIITFFNLHWLSLRAFAVLFMLCCALATNDTSIGEADRFSILFLAWSSSFRRASSFGRLLLFLGDLNHLFVTLRIIGTPGTYLQASIISFSDLKVDLLHLVRQCHRAMLLALRTWPILWQWLISSFLYHKCIIKILLVTFLLHSQPLSNMLDAQR